MEKQKDVNPKHSVLNYTTFFIFPIILDGCQWKIA